MAKRSSNNSGGKQHRTNVTSTELTDDAAQIEARGSQSVAQRQGTERAAERAERDSRRHSDEQQAGYSSPAVEQPPAE